MFGVPDEPVKVSRWRPLIVKVAIALAIILVVYIAINM